jgi:hypothetical protein
VFSQVEAEAAAIESALQLERARGEARLTAISQRTHAINQVAEACDLLSAQAPR